MKKKNTTKALMQTIECKDIFEKITLEIGKDEKITVNITRRLSIADQRKFFDDILSWIFVDSSEGERIYCPHYKELAFKYCVISYFSDLQMPSDVNKIYQIIDGSSVYNDISKAIGDEYLSFLFACLNEMVNHELLKSVNKSRFDKFIDAADSYLKELSKVINGLSPETIEKIVSDTGIDNLLKKDTETPPRDFRETE